MHRFFCSKKAVTGNTIIINDTQELRHMKNVLRLKEGDDVVAFDEEGTSYPASIMDISAGSATLAVKERIPYTSSGIRLNVACALAKNARMDDIVDKLTQLGVERIIPMKTQRVIVKWDAKKEAAHHKRWQAIAVGASKQSGCGRVPLVDPVRTFQEVVGEAAHFDCALIPTLAGDRTSLKDSIGARHSGSILILIGPEGDFTPEEVEEALKAGCRPVTLGPYVLRVDTAAIAVAAFIMFSAGQR